MNMNKHDISTENHNSSWEEKMVIVFSIMLNLQKSIYYRITF